MDEVLRAGTANIVGDNSAKDSRQNGDVHSHLQKLMPLK